MTDSVFASIFFATVYFLGWPLSGLLPGRRPDVLLAPVMGFGAWSVAITLLYMCGLSLPLSGLFVLATAASVWFIYAWRNKCHISVPGLPAAILLAMIVMALAPGFSGGESFRVFQGNDQDQLNYLSFSSVYQRLGYGALLQAGNTELLSNSAISGAQKMLEGRPAVSLSFAAFGSLARMPLAETSYAYLACLQALLGFAVAFLIRGLTTSPLLAAIGGAAFALGFFGQFALDLNAWSQLAGMSLATAGLGLLLRFGFRAPLPSGLLLASLVYIYPEGIALYGTAALPLLLRRLRATSARTAAGLAWMLTTTLLLLIPLLTHLPAYLKQQAGVSTEDESGWARHFFAFLFGRDGKAFETLSIQTDSTHLLGGLLRTGVNVMAGLTGLYPLSGGMMMATTLLILFLSALITLPFVTSHGPRAQRLCLTLGAGTIYCLGGLALGHPYIAGKAWLLLSPVLFSIVLLPLLQPTAAVACRAPACLYLGLQIGFGLWRPIAAMAPDGIAYAPPYPALPQAKAEVDWAVLSRRLEFAGCRLVQLEIDSPTLDRYLQTVLSEWGVTWRSIHPITTDYANPKSVSLGVQPGSGQPDCVATDVLPQTDPGAARLIWLGRHAGLNDFVSGRSNTLDMLQLPLDLHGLHDIEIWRNAPLRWTDGQASFLLAVPQPNRGFTIDIGLWPIREPDTRLQLRINGVELFSGVLPEGHWERHYDVPPTSAALHIEILSTSFQPENDPRRLGVSLQELTVTSK